jgi:hypothetical protein
LSALRQFVDEHRARRLRFAAAAVPDHGINLRREPAGVVLRLPPKPAEPPPEPPKRPKLRVGTGYLVDRVSALVAQHYGCTWAQFTSATRRAAIVWPRQVGVYIAKRVTNRSMSYIARRYCRDHTTIMYSVAKVEARCRDDFAFGSQMAALECSIRRQVVPKK